MRNTRRSEGWEQLSVSQLWRRTLAVNLAAAVISFLLIIALYRLRTPRQIALAFFYPMVCANVMGGLITMGLIRFGRRLYFQPFPLNWILIGAVILSCTVAGSLAANLLFLALGLPPADGFWASFRLVTEFAAVIALAFGTAAVAYEIFGTSLAVAGNELRNAQMEEQRARQCALEAQLASLESQIRPHFLFNTLNTISSLIQDDPKLAESLVGKLAGVLRFSLDAHRQRVSPLSAEIQIVTQYLEIEHARFGERLRFEIEILPDMERAEVPAFCLQTLVENSVKYAVADRLDGGWIRVAARAGDGGICLEVSDDGPGLTLEAIPPGHGLDNLRRRLAALFGPQAKMEIVRDAGHTTVRLRIPQVQSVNEGE